MDIDDVMRDMYTEDAMAERKATSLAAYEEKVIKKILTYAGLQEEAKTLAFKCKEKTGKAKLNFEWFFEEYPSFPAYLTMRKIPFAFQVTVKDLFNKFHSTPMASAWYEFIDEAPVEPSYPKGLVFDWPGMKGTQAVLHDWDHAIPWFDGNVRVVCGPKSKNAQLLVIEQFGPFLDRTLENWII